MDKVFALVDCNNFFVSCERVFNPALHNRPVVVLSNNDGCIIARSNEAKQLGIAMGEPYFKCLHILKKHNVTVLSSNYQLYADMSRRVMQSLHMLASDIEIYSIDEAFLRLQNTENLTKFAHSLRQKILQWTGIPISCGIASTKTLAKIANNIAKKHIDDGVLNVQSHALQHQLLSKLLVTDIWGISHRWGQKLNALGIYTALQLRNSDAKFIRKYFGVIGERIIYELRGISCLALSNVTSKKTIISSRSFGQPVTSIDALEEATANHTARACEKLRAQNSKAAGIYVFIKTNKFHDPKSQYKYTLATSFECPTSDTRRIISSAKTLLRRIYQKNNQYKKCGIMLFDISPSNYEQSHLFSAPDPEKGQKLMTVMDNLNNSMGANSVFYLAQGITRGWQMRRNHCSPCYTTKWNDIPQVYCNTHT